MEHPVFIGAEAEACWPSVRWIDEPASQRVLPSVGDVLREVGERFGFRSDELTSQDRHKSVALARHVAMYLCKRRLGRSFPEVARAFGKRDHTTVISAVRKIEARLNDSDMRGHLEVLERILGTGGRV